MCIRDRSKTLFYAFFPGGGIGKYTHEVLEALSAHHAADVDFELVCQPEFEWLDQATYPKWPRLFSIKHAWAPLRKARFLIAQLLNPLRLASRARETKPAWIHFCNINPLTYPLWRSRIRRSGARLAATAHDVRRAKRIVHLGWENRQLARFYRDCDALFVHSQKQAEDLMAFAAVPAERIHVVPHGPYTFHEAPHFAEMDKAALRRHYDLPDSTRVALFYGFIRDEKQLDVLLDAIAGGADDWRLLIAGSSGAKGHKPVSYYADKIAALGLDLSLIHI